MTDSAEKMELMPCPFEEIIFRINDYIQKCNSSMEEMDFGGKKWTEHAQLRLDAYKEKQAVELVRDKFGKELLNTRSAPSRVTGDEVGECPVGFVPYSSYKSVCDEFAKLEIEAQKLRIQASRPTQDSDIFTEEEIAAVVANVRKEVKPTLAAAQIRAKVSSKFDSGKDKYNTEADAMPAYIWDVVDIAVHTALTSPPPEADRQRALESLEWLEILGGRHEEPSIVGAFKRVREYITAPQPHVGVEVTVEEIEREIKNSMSAFHPSAFTALRSIIHAIQSKYKITAQKKGDEK